MATMEKGLYERMNIGVQDFVLLDDYENEDSFINNLRKRFELNLIYTYIGQVLISVNPYKHLPIYSQTEIMAYRKKHFFEVPPHIFAVADNALQSLIDQNMDQCILISGESGSGKTVASQKILQYIAATSSHQNAVSNIKNKLLQSNPVLEAFGNAKTNRNENSSRFGKYMDIQFDCTGSPIGGNILNYLLEKSRVVKQSTGERNFHIFYQLLVGANEEFLKKLYLKRNLSDYYYLTNGESYLNAKSDQVDFKKTQMALTVLNFSSEEQDQIFHVIASVLHLGNICFTDHDGKANISKTENISIVAELIGCNVNELSQGMVNRTIEVKDDIVKLPLSRDMAIFARDALAKAIYDRIFAWLINRINVSLQVKDFKSGQKIGILDIYGFEILKNNSFEQFCINYCNEKLQQLFVELTLKSEQEEYEREGIEWISVKYFDNKIICDLIEEKHMGVIAILDEECLRPGKTTDFTLLDKLINQLQDHPYFICNSKPSTQLEKSIYRNEFQLVHYAGNVKYNIDGFLNKNNDLLFRDLKESMSKARNVAINSCFLTEECEIKKRPSTVATKFKISLNNLMELLMCKEPSYIRCIKPNELQLEGRFDNDLVSHQVKYLGLMENLRIRRAGFAYRRSYEMFLQRYKCLSKSTWPNFNGPVKDGVEVLIRDLKFSCEDYQLGKSKIFIRYTKMLFEIEDKFQIQKNVIAAIIQSRWKGRRQRKLYLRLKEMIIILQSYCRRRLAIQRWQRKRSAVDKIHAFLKGFITRNGPPNSFNAQFFIYSKRMWLIRLSKELPKNLLTPNWPPAPHHCLEASKYIQYLHRLHLAKIYRNQLSFENKRQFELKIIAENVFKGRKSSYPSSIRNWFQDNRVSSDNLNNINKFTATRFKGESLKYASPCIKYDRRGYKARERFILLSNRAIYLLDAKSYEEKHCLALEKIYFSVTNRSDNFMLIGIPTEIRKDKGDLILEIPHIVEFCSFVVETVGEPNILHIIERATLQHNMLNGKSGVIEIQIGTKPGINRNKNGHLNIIVRK